MGEAEPHLILIDGSSYLYRAFHALPPLETRDGRPTQAIYGVINMLRRVVREQSPSHLAVVFDAPGRTFRDDLFARYKANRPPMPEAMREQIKPLLAIIRALGLPLLQVEGVEADDVIATLARQAAADGYRVTIATGDKDMAQLVNSKIELVDTMRDTRLNRAGVVAKFGVGPEQIVDLLALMGDTADNIPGIPGVGVKTAAKWLQKYGDLNALIHHAGDIKGKVGEKLRAHLEQLQLSRQLATIHDEVKLSQSPAQLVPSKPDRQSLEKLYRKCEFHAWLKELGAGDIRPPESYETVDDDATFEQWMERLHSADLIAIDTETTSLSYLDARLVGIAISIQPGQAIYIPLTHKDGRQLALDRVLARLRSLLESNDHPKVGHHLKYDAHVFANHGIALRGIRHDTMLESYVLNSTDGRHDLDSVAWRTLERRTQTYEEVAGKGVHQLRFDEVSIQDATPYAAEDAEVTMALHRELYQAIQADPGLSYVYDNLEIPLVPVLLAMERTGVLIDCDALAEQSRRIADRMQLLEDQIFRDAGTEEFNLASPAQLQTVLYEKIGLPVLRRTSKGQPSTAEAVLQELADQHHLPKLILEYRGLAKLRSTYTDRLPQQVNPATGRVHTSYHQAVVATGRLSSSDPNLQNIPVRTDAGRQIRKAFIAPTGTRIVAADYSQVELRIMAHLSGDERLLEAFGNAEDIHRATAAEVFERELDQVTSEERRAAKAINFGLIYGMSAFGLSRQLGVDRGSAQDYIDRYFARYPKVYAFMDAMREQARRDGFVSTLFGRRLYVPEIRSRNAQRRQYAERTAINAPMQGSAADIIKRAMIEIHRWLAREEPESRLIMQVHDELVFEVPADRVVSVADGIRSRMRTAADLRVPLEVDLGIGDNWDEAH